MSHVDINNLVYLQAHLEVAIKNCKRFRLGHRELYGNVMEILGVGSTHAKELCEFYGLDPYFVISEDFDWRLNES